MGRKLALLFASFFSALLVGELFLRAGMRADDDGQLFLRGRPIPPVVFPLRHFAKLVEASRDESVARLRFDAVLGWSPARSFVSDDTMYVYDATGIRVGVDVRRMGEPRVLFLGDSFVHGDEVVADSTMAAFLEEARPGAVTRNLGVSGYGTDQAILRYLQRDDLEADVVVLGFQRENVVRNLNVVRALYQPRTGLPFSKPRFELDGAGQARLVDFRPVPPADLEPLILRFLGGENAVGEGVGRSSDFRPRWFERLRVGGLVSAVIEPRSPVRRRADEWIEDRESEAQRLTWSLVAMFDERVRERGARPVVLLLPTIEDLRRASEGRAPRSMQLIEDFERSFELVDPTSALAECAQQHGLEELFVVAHYSPRAHRVIARKLGAALGDRQPE